jgi:hypothetical protein
LISYEKDVHIDNKLNCYFKITVIVNNMFRTQKTLKETIIKLYNTLALPAVLCGSGKRTIKGRKAKKSNRSRDEIYEEKTAGCTWTDYKTNTEFTKELIWPQLRAKYRNTEAAGCDM